MSDHVIINIGASGFSINPEAEFALGIVNDDKVIFPVEPIKKDTNKSTVYQKWGADNNYPQYVLDSINRNTILLPTIAWKTRQMTSGGLMYGVVTGMDVNGNEIFERQAIDEIDGFVENNDLDSFAEEAMSDMYTYNIMFPELLLNENRTKFVALWIEEAYNCRFAKRNPKTGIIDSIFIDKNWPNGKAETWREVSHIEKYYGIVDRIKFDKKKSKSYIISNSFASPGCDYYQNAAWHTFLASGWGDIASSIADFKKYLLKNQMSIKYLVHVPLSWWQWKYPNFDQMDSVQRKTVVEEEHKKFNNLLSGVEHTGKSIFLTFRDATESNREYAQWKIVALNGTSDLSDKFLEDSKESSSHALYSLATDVALIGALPGNGMGAGSGSDKREANNIFVINNTPYQKKVLHPLNIISQFNEWTIDGKRIVWRFNNYMLRTLNFGVQASSTSAVSTNSN